ncbi:hypothetical protein H0B56_05940 [Haloechinothrix sp. YIM 98757]|uniref:Uncharacterized protein n=1 Tax=Haloechinothrix aidingensis TaxID=2752311 RepID=A0A838A934_9PSEU|nr:hypothetical protein [Haloechinothrix aidingensis]MBA0125079.1 hypothetical protein [Haloechinothrix aidingensis]
MTNPWIQPQDAQQSDSSTRRLQRRWPWIVGIIGAFLFGIAIGAAGSEPEPLADDAPAVQNRLAELDERADKLDERANSLDELESEVESRSHDLDERAEKIEEAELEIEEGTVPGDGVWVVGEDIEAGTYRGNAEGRDCYWARLSGTSGDFGDLITNGNSSGPTVVTIQDSDAAFETNRCGEWRKQ